MRLLALALAALAAGRACSRPAAARGGRASPRRRGPRRPRRSRDRDAERLRLPGHGHRRPARSLPRGRTRTSRCARRRFGSNQEAAAKLAGGFEADVVEVCLDEMSPLTARNLLRPLDPTGITDWDELVFRDSPGVVEGGDVLDGAALGRAAGPDLRRRRGRCPARSTPSPTSSTRSSPTGSRSRPTIRCRRSPRRRSRWGSRTR